MRIETVRIKHGEGYAVINASDFKPSEHERFDSLATQAVESLASEAVEVPAAQIVEVLTVQVADSPATQVVKVPPVKRLARRRKATV